MVTDTISDMLTRIRNAIAMHHHMVEIPPSKMSFAIALILKEEGFIENFDYSIINEKNYLVIFLKYFGKSDESVISTLKRISKPGLRIYNNSTKLPIVRNNLGIAILSTSKGIITNKQALNLGIGGEVLCYIW